MQGSLGKAGENGRGETRLFTEYPLCTALRKTLDVCYLIIRDNQNSINVSSATLLRIIPGQRSESNAFTTEVPPALPRSTNAILSASLHAL